MFEAERTKRTVTWPYWHRVIVVGACLIVTLLSLTSGWSLWRLRNDTLAKNERELSSISSAIAEQTTRSLQGVELLLRRAAVLTDVERVGTSSSSSTEFLRGQTGGVPQIRELTVADASGKLIASSAAADGSAINISARPYFQYLEHAKGDAIAVSEPITKEAAPQTDEWYW